MANAVIGALRVVLGADTAALDKGLKDAQGSLARFASSMKNVGLVAAGALAGALGGTAVAMKGMIDQADKMGKMAQSFGLPVAELSRLKHAADLSGVGVESLGKSMGRLSKSMMEVAGGAKNDVSQTLNALGISIKNVDGSLKSSSQVMADVAGKFASMEDGAGKTAIAMRLFGKSGAELIPMLNAGKTGLQDMMQEADALGIVIDTKTAKAAEAFNDNLTRLARVKDGFILKITQELLPAMQLLSQRFVDAAKDGTTFQNAAQGVANMIKFIASEAAGGILAIQRLGTELSALWNVITSIGSSNFGAAWKQFQEAGTETERQFANLKNTVSEFWNAAAANAEAGAADTGKRLAAPIIEASSVANKVVAEGEALYKKTLASAVSVFESTRTPLEEYKIKLAEISMLHQQGLISADTWARAQAKAADTAGMSFKQAVPSILGSFQEITQGFGKENARMAKAAQVIGAVQALIATLVGQAEALKLPFPANMAAVAAIAAKGFALVAAIKTQKVPGFKTGGSFKVGGGGGPDSQLVQFAATPGEMVDVRRPGDAGYDQGARSITEVTVNMVGEVFNRETYRKMIDGLNEMHTDGYRLKIA